jgi:hypothetical protein
VDIIDGELGWTAPRGFIGMRMYMQIHANASGLPPGAVKNQLRQFITSIAHTATSQMYPHVMVR